ncbi:MAG: cytochrome b N-terminal domain-containing protein [Alphaproteobacteria bacterium]|nr:cytochrome b N-terminal domain-containing protein [Alphaproteobacteria bacterium]
MRGLQSILRRCFQVVEGALDRIFTPAWNPFHHFGALGFFYFWVVAVTGVYIYIFFDTSTSDAYESVEYLTHDQWYLGGVMRSLHRYASDGMVLMMAVHIVREFAFDRYRGARWFTWVTGVPILWFVMIAGITGYWLVWDELAQYVAIRTTEWLDWLPIFGEPVARNFLSPSNLDDRFFTLLVFLHIAVPLFLLLFLWIHLNRVTRPRINPPRGLAIGTFGMLLVLSIVKPATSHGPANLSAIPTTLDLDWFYLGFYPLMDMWSHGAVWGFAAVVTLILVLLPRMPPMRRPAAAMVNLEHCNGCTRCEEDCPYAAIVMAPRTDGRPFAREAVVSSEKCVACGICAGSCPTSTPFRRRSELLPGIDLPDSSIKSLRERLDAASAGLVDGPKIVLFGCDHGADVRQFANAQIAAVSLPCIGMLPPSFIDYALSRELADGVFITACRHGECHNRLGVVWTEARLAGQRDPALRSRVPRERIDTMWAAPTDARALRERIDAFAVTLSGLPRRAAPAIPKIAPARRATDATAEAHGDD